MQKLVINNYNVFKYKVEHLRLSISLSLSCPLLSKVLPGWQSCNIVRKHVKQYCPRDLQLWRENGQPEFPPCPWRLYKQRRMRQPCLQVTPPGEHTESDDEQEPLLAAHRSHLRELPSWLQRSSTRPQTDWVDPT